MSEEITVYDVEAVQQNADRLPTIRRAGLPTFRTKQDVEAFIEQAALQWEAYQELTRRLLDDTDYQKIGNRQFKKKSAWRKYARAFDLSCEKLSEEIVRDEQGWPKYARVVVRAIAPDGRFQDGDQECHITERCCQEPCGKRNWSNHFCCKADCNGKKHFSHPGDLPATAFTRAKNRAISDLIGAGEVSAEEMSETPAEDAAPAKRTPRKPAAPKLGSLPTFEAKYDRVCTACGMPIPMGDMYAFDAAGKAIYHPKCAPAQEPPTEDEAGMPTDASA